MKSKRALIPPRYVAVRDLAEFFSLSIPTANRLAHRLGVVRVGPRTIRVSVEVIEREYGAATARQIAKRAAERLHEGKGG